MVLITAPIRLLVRLAGASGIETPYTGIETPDLSDHSENYCISAVHHGAFNLGQVQLDAQIL